MNYPCRNCERRAPACHGSCPEYLAVKAAEKEARSREQIRSLPGSAMTEWSARRANRFATHIRTRRNIVIHGNK